MSVVYDITAGLVLRLAGAPDDEIDTTITATLERLAGAVDAERAYVELFHDDGAIEVSHEWHRDAAGPRPPAGGRWLREHPHAAELAVGGDVLVCTEVTALPAGPERDELDRLGVRAWLQVPIMVDGGCLGVLGWHSSSERPPWDADVVASLRQVAGVIGVVILRRQAHAGRQLARARRDEAARLKDASIAAASRELRLPLHALLGDADLLDTHGRDRHERQPVEQIRANGRRLLAMLDDLIDLVEHDPEADERFELLPLLRSVLARLEPAAASHGVGLTLLAPGDGDDPLSSGDVDRFRHLVHCVVSGALQLVGPGGFATVAPRAADDDRSGPAVVVRLESSRRLSATDLRLPLALALARGHASIGIVDADGALTVTIRLDQTTSP